jgi:hypothetical protein
VIRVQTRRFPKFTICEIIIISKFIWNSWMHAFMWNSYHHRPCVSVSCTLRIHKWWCDGGP